MGRRKSRTDDDSGKDWVGQDLGRETLGWDKRMGSGLNGHGLGGTKTRCETILGSGRPRLGGTIVRVTRKERKSKGLSGTWKKTTSDQVES